MLLSSQQSNKHKWERTLEPFPTQRQVREAQTEKTANSHYLPHWVSDSLSTPGLSKRMKRTDFRDEQGLSAQCHMHSEVNSCSWHRLLGWPAALSCFLLSILSISFGEFTTAPAWKVSSSQFEALCSSAKAEQGRARPPPGKLTMKHKAAGTHPSHSARGQHISA